LFGDRLTRRSANGSMDAATRRYMMKVEIRTTSAEVMNRRRKNVVIEAV